MASDLFPYSFVPLANGPWRRCIGLTLRLMAFLLVVGLGVESRAQEPKRDAERAPAENAAEPGTPMGTDDMRNMASAMKSMADMCRMMMEREMQFRPYLIAAGAIVGTLLVIALVLFIVLEVQWIRFFGLRNQTERKKLSQPHGIP